MIKLVKPFLKQIGDIHASKENLSKPVVAIFFLTLILSAYATEIIGIHALFGAFLAGVIMPDNMKFRNLFIEKVEDISLVLLLPLFFVFTGLRTQIGLLDSVYLWQTCGLIILVAVVGKFIGSALAAKFVGQTWKDSFMIGALMNTRGLMELVVLNIGYDLGVLTPEVFAMMVIMALVTTFMTGPALDLINYIFKNQKDESIIRISKSSKFNILLSFGNSDKSRNLLKLSNSFVKKMDKNATITAMHLSLSDQLNHYNLEEYQTETFAPIVEESKELNQKITTFFKASVDIENDIVDVANKGSFDLLIIGYGNSIYDGTFLGKLFGFTTKIINPDRIIDKVTGKEKLFESNPFDERIRFIISKTEIPVGILVERDLGKINKVFVPIEDENDDFIFEYSEKLIDNSDAEIVVWQNEESNSGFQLIKENIIAINEKYPNKIHATNNKTIDKKFLNDFDLILISIETWKKINESDDNWLEDCPSLLIIKY
jgi:hypothetical protein